MKSFAVVVVIFTRFMQSYPFVVVFFFFFIPLEPRVEEFKRLCALNTSLPQFSHIHTAEPGPGAVGIAEGVAERHSDAERARGGSSAVVKTIRSHKNLKRRELCVLQCARPESRPLSVFFPFSHLDRLL